MLPKKMGVLVCTLSMMVGQGGVNTHLAWSESKTASSSAAIQGTNPIRSNSPITSKQVISLLLEHNQEIAALGWQVKSREAASLQSVLLPNPELALEVENFAGTGAMEGFNSAESTLSLSQLIELGGKRSIRRLSGNLDVEMAGLEYQARKSDLVADAKLAFVEVLAAQEKLLVAEEQLKVAEEVTGVVVARVQAGKVSAIESTKAQVSLSISRINLNNARRELLVSRKSLALFWGSTEPLFSEAVGDLMDFPAEKPTIEVLTKQLPHHLLIKKAALAVEQARTRVRISQISKVPDLTISGGYKNFGDGNDHAFVAGISIPLPTFDRNQGGIAEATHDLARAKSDLASLKTGINAELNLAYDDLLAAELETGIITDQVLPSAKSAFEAVREGYRQGKFSYLEVLDAQKTLFEVTLSRIEASSAYQASSLQLQRLTGLELN